MRLISPMAVLALLPFVTCLTTIAASPLNPDQNQNLTSRLKPRSNDDVDPTLKEKSWQYWLESFSNRWWIFKNPDPDMWNTIIGKGEYVTYVDSNLVVRPNNNEMLEIIPKPRDDGTWTSGMVTTRLPGWWKEHKEFHCEEGKAVLFSTKVNIGNMNTRMLKGIEPMIYILGVQYRDRPEEWARLPRIELLHLKNSEEKYSPAIHCGEQGPCPEPYGWKFPTPIDFGHGEDYDLKVLIDRRMCPPDDPISKDGACYYYYYYYYYY